MTRKAILLLLFQDSPPSFTPYQILPHHRHGHFHCSRLCTVTLRLRQLTSIQSQPAISMNSQRCQNTAAHLILQQSFTPSIQDLMNQLHWLPIQARIDFKIATLTYKALSSGQPAYLGELISPYKPSRQLRSSDQSLLTMPRTNLTIGQRAFSWSSVLIWNSIPLSVGNAPTTSIFKRRLKTFYFSSISS